MAGTGFGMRADLAGAKAEAAWKWIWFYSGPIGSAIRQGFGANPAYILPPRGDLDLLIKKLMAFVNMTPGGYVVDSVMDADGMGVLHPLLQEMMFGQQDPAAGRATSTRPGSRPTTAAARERTRRESRPGGRSHRAGSRGDHPEGGSR